MPEPVDLPAWEPSARAVLHAAIRRDYAAVEAALGRIGQDWWNDVPEILIVWTTWAIDYAARSSGSGTTAAPGAAILPTWIIAGKDGAPPHVATSADDPALNEVDRWSGRFMAACACDDWDTVDALVGVVIERGDVGFWSACVSGVLSASAEMIRQARAGNLAGVVAFPDAERHGLR